jgi:hypothetical protein
VYTSSFPHLTQWHTQPIQINRNKLRNITKLTEFSISLGSNYINHKTSAQNSRIHNSLSPGWSVTPVTWTAMLLGATKKRVGLRSTISPCKTLCVKNPDVRNRTENLNDQWKVKSPMSHILLLGMCLVHKWSIKNEITQIQCSCCGNSRDWIKCEGCMGSNAFGPQDLEP